MALHGSSAARFGLLHRNVPGVLARADAVVGAHGLNVDGQVLATRGELGYAVAVRLSTFARPPAASALDGLS